MEELQKEELDGLETEALECERNTTPDAEQPYVKLYPKFALRWIREHRRLQSLSPPLIEGKEECEWKPMDEFDDTGNYDTSCGQAFSIVEGSPELNGFKYCTYCGKKLVVPPQRKGRDE